MKLCWGPGFDSRLGRLRFFSVSAKASRPISLSPFPPIPKFPFPSPFDLSFVLKNASSHLSHQIIISLELEHAKSTFNDGFCILSVKQRHILTTTILLTTSFGMRCPSLFQPNLLPQPDLQKYLLTAHVHRCSSIPRFHLVPITQLTSGRRSRLNVRFAAWSGVKSNTICLLVA